MGRKDRLAAVDPSVASKDRMPPLRAIRTFVVAARHVNFTRAAEELQMTQGSVSRQIAALEDWLGHSLFHRSSIQLALTEAGRQYLARIEPLLEQLAAASHEVRAEPVVQILRVDVPPTTMLRWLIPRMAGFLRAWPGVELRLTGSLDPLDFRSSRYDVAIRPGRTPPPGCVAHSFMSERMVPVCNPVLLDGESRLPPQALQNHTLIVYDVFSDNWPVWLEQAGVPGLRPVRLLPAEQMQFALQAAVDGLGIAMVPLFMAADDIAAGRLCMPFGLLACQSHSYFACHAASAAGRPLVHAFIDWLRHEGQTTEESVAQLCAV